jgi:class I fructose-bisphosphate aldolase
MREEQIEELLGDEAEFLLRHTCRAVPKERLTLPGADVVDRCFAESDRNPRVLRSLQTLFSHGRLANTGYLSILPVDQGVEHSAGASFAANPRYFDPEEIVRLAMEGGCNAVASSVGVLGMVARKYAHKIPFVLKLNHNELLTYPNRAEQITWASVNQARDMGAVAVGATVYFGSQDSAREIVTVAEAFARAHDAGLATILWCYLRNPAFVSGEADHHLSADLTGQANHLGATLGADIVKQKLPLQNGGFRALNQGGSSYGKLDERIYTELSTPHPIDLCRYQVLNAFAGRVGLISSGGPAGGADDLRDAVRTAVINKRAGGIGLISGRKAFQREFSEGVALLHAIQSVYLSPNIGIA